MNKKVLLIAVVAILAIAGCSKTDNATAWVGSYTGTSLTNGFSKVIVSEINSTTLKMILQDTILGTQNIATLQNVTLTNATTANINETGTALYSGDTAVLFTGTASLNGNTLNIQGSAKNNVSLVSKAYSFTGTK